MYVSAKLEYAVRALAVLDRAQGTRVPATDIARAENLAPTYMRTVLVELSHARLVAAVRGSSARRQPGYALSRPVAAISMSELLDALRLPVAEYSGALLGPESSEVANIAKLWNAIELTVRRLLDQVSVRAVIDGTFSPEVRELVDESRPH